MGCDIQLAGMQTGREMSPEFSGEKNVWGTAQGNGPVEICFSHVELRISIWFLWFVPPWLTYRRTHSQTVGQKCTEKQLFTGYTRVVP